MAKDVINGYCAGFASLDIHFDVCACAHLEGVGVGVFEFTDIGKFRDRFALDDHSGGTMEVAAVVVNTFQPVPVCAVFYFSVFKDVGLGAAGIGGGNHDGGDHHGSFLAFDGVTIHSVTKHLGFSLGYPVQFHIAAGNNSGEAAELDGHGGRYFTGFHKYKVEIGLHVDMIFGKTFHFYEHVFSNIIVFGFPGVEAKGIGMHGSYRGVSAYKCLDIIIVPSGAVSKILATLRIGYPDVIEVHGIVVHFYPVGVGVVLCKKPNCGKDNRED